MKNMLKTWFLFNIFFSNRKKHVFQSIFETKTIKYMYFLRKFLFKGEKIHLLSKLKVIVSQENSHSSCEKGKVNGGVLTLRIKTQLSFFFYYCKRLKPFVHLKTCHSSCEKEKKIIFLESEWIIKYNREYF